MPQSLHQTYAHLVFSTKNRAPLITAEIETELYNYLGGIVRNLKATPIAINGMPDHVHLIIQSSKHTADTEFIRQLKGSSSKWMTEKGSLNFAWQAGYGWFSLSHKDLPAAIGYVEKKKNITPK